MAAGDPPPLCPDCTRPMRLVRSPYTQVEFWICCGFSSCRGVRFISDPPCPTSRTEKAARDADDDD